MTWKGVYAECVCDGQLGRENMTGGIILKDLIQQSKAGVEQLLSSVIH